MRLVHREFVYVGDPVPEINEQEYGAFLLEFQKALLSSLKKRNLLNHSQYVKKNGVLVGCIVTLKRLSL